MTLRGSLQDFPLRAILDLLAQTKKTGELQFHAGDRAGALGLANGRVVTAVLGEEEPVEALSSIFALEGAEFEFTAWDEAPPANLEGELDDLLKKAEERRKWLASVRAVIPNDRVTFRLSERAVDQGAVTFTAERWRVVLAVNGDRDVTAVAAMLHMDHDAALTVLAGLVRDGVIDALVPTEEPAPSARAAEAVAPIAPAAPVFEPAPPPAPEPPLPEPPAMSESVAETLPEPAVEPYAPTPEIAPAETTPPAAQEWIAPEEAAPPSWEAPAQSWESPAPAEPPPWETVTPSEASPAADAAPPSDAPALETTAPPPDWVAPAPAQEWAAPQPAQEWVAPEPAPEVPSSDDRLSALSGIFGPAPTEPVPPPPPPADAAGTWGTPAPSAEQWGTPAPTPPAAERWSTPPATDPWGRTAQAAPASGQWTAPPTAPSAWGAPAAPPPSADPWGAPAPTAPPAATNIAEPAIPAVEEWSPPPVAAPEKRKRGLFGFGREKPAPAPVPGTPLPTAGVVGSRAGMLASLANALITEYNGGQYGKGRIDEHIANLLMRVDEQADPIDRPLPIVDDRIDVGALEREHLSEDQAVPYLALLVTTIFADAERTFGKDKAKKGYKAAQKTVLLGDASALSAPELAGKLPRV